MTSRSLRKLQITLWSTLLKTEGTATSGTRAQWLRSAGLAGLTALTLVASANAEEKSGRARLDNASASPMTEPATATRQKSQSSDRRRQPPVRTATNTRLLPPSEMPAEELFMDFGVASAAPLETEVSDLHYPDPVPPQSSVKPKETQTAHASSPTSVRRPASAPEIAAQAKQQIAGEADRSYSRTEAVQDGFSSRMNQVLTGGMVSTSADSVGEWWQERSQRMVNPQAKRKSQHGQRLGAGQKISNATGRMMDRITLPDEPVPEVDFYDAGPVAVSSASRTVVMASADEGSNDQDDSTAITPASRLKTDIRSIKPTLSYALKNIDKEQLPEDFESQVDTGEYIARQSSPTVYQWAPTNLYHFPLYFEDPSLERYGHTYHPLVQPFASSGRFATQLVGLPYQMALHPVHSKEYALGYYRPGECAPKKHYQIPFNEEATIVEVATIVGLFLIIP